MVLVDNLGKSIAKELGVKYMGIQEGFEDIPGFYLFEDPVTGTSFAGNDLEEAKQSLQNKRIAFGRA